MEGNNKYLFHCPLLEIERGHKQIKRTRTQRIRRRRRRRGSGRITSHVPAIWQCIRIQIGSSFVGGQQKLLDICIGSEDSGLKGGPINYYIAPWRSVESATWICKKKDVVYAWQPEDTVKESLEFLLDVLCSLQPVIASTLTSSAPDHLLRNVVVLQ